MKWIGTRTCIRCGRILSVNNSMDICYNCRENDHSYDKGYACCEYGQLARSIVFNLKYHDQTDISLTVAEIMHDRLEASRDEIDYDIIIPVPIHEDKLGIRGYNQAGIIAEELAKLEGKPCEQEILVRTATTSAMKNLTPAERRINIQGAFVVRSEGQRGRELLFGKRILLIDDIYTTGATADEIATVLKKAGAKTVDVLCFAIGADIVKSL